MTAALLTDPTIDPTDHEVFLAIMLSPRLSQEFLFRLRNGESKEAFRREIVRFANPSAGAGAAHKEFPRRDSRGVKTENK